ncbi:hypothetical protein [Myroides sp. N17-2]|uniref:hypothetical protein n=1 Tax=Myroides sp. N17-2 TaxID=2030799 RepID=UPI000EFB09D7|nr:hypothetical protein [Myroides sp. N17-2]
MATINGFIRSYGAAVKRAEREQQRKTREAAKKFKAQQKQIEFKNVALAVKEWNEYITIIKSLHIDASEKINWQTIKYTSRPIEPNYSNNNEIQAQQKLNNYKPSMFDKLLGSTKRKITKLENQILLAKSKDNTFYQNLLKEYEANLNEWNELQKMSIGIEKKSTQTYLDVIKYFEPFTEISELGSQIRFSFEQNHIEIDICTNSIDIIPTYELKQTTTGKLSKKNMSKTNFYELYQDHICSVVLRISREIFAHLPVDFTIVNALSEMVDPQSGHLEKKVILSVKVMPETIEKLNLLTIDPSDSMKNFIHNMNFKKTQGFQAVERIQ